MTGADHRQAFSHLGGVGLRETQVDWSDAASVIEYLVDYSRVLAGGQHPFDEAAVRELIDAFALRIDRRPPEPCLRGGEPHRRTSVGCGANTRGPY
jgi:hypothetical protein